MASTGQNLMKISALRTSCLDSLPARVPGLFRDGRSGIRKNRLNKTLQATPVDASVEVLSRGSGVPELGRSVNTFGHGRGFDGGGLESQTCSDHRSRIDCGGHGQPQTIGPRMAQISRIQISDRLAWGLSVPSVKSVVKVLW